MCWTLPYVVKSFRHRTTCTWDDAKNGSLGNIVISFVSNRCFSPSLPARTVHCSSLLLSADIKRPRWHCYSMALHWWSSGKKRRLCMEMMNGFVRSLVLSACRRQHSTDWIIRWRVLIDCSTRGIASISSKWKSPAFLSSEVSGQKIEEHHVDLQMSRRKKSDRNHRHPHRFSRSLLSLSVMKPN